jgi:SAM-dependent methyltransferase
MNRKEILLEGITKSQLGLEIGPYHAPLVPKSEGYNSLSLDVLDEHELRKRAISDPNISQSAIARIEPVDLVGSVTRLGDMIESKDLVGRLDYVISSHNFEHIPDPIRFLQVCDRCLKPGGLLIMAIPDRRTHFDYFRPHSVSGDLIAAYFESRTRPTAHQLFVEYSLCSRFHVDGEQRVGFYLTDDPSRNIPWEVLTEAFEMWKSLIETPDEEYRDTHCWTFTPASFELIMNDLWFLGLSRMGVHSIVGPNGNEFYARLAVTPEPLPSDREAFYSRRAVLLHRINDEAAANCMAVFAEHSRGTISPPAAAAEPPRDLTRVVAELTWQVAELRQQLAAMETSTSWRITAPARALLRAFRGS